MTARKVHQDYTKIFFAMSYSTKQNWIHHFPQHPPSSIHTQRSTMLSMIQVQNMNPTSISSFLSLLLIASLSLSSINTFLIMFSCSHLLTTLIITLVQGFITLHTQTLATDCKLISLISASPAPNQSYCHSYYQATLLLEKNQWLSPDDRKSPNS